MFLLVLVLLVVLAVVVGFPSFSGFTLGFVRVGVEYVGSVGVGSSLSGSSLTGVSSVLGVGDVNASVIREHLKDLGAFVVLDRGGEFYSRVSAVLGEYGVFNVERVGSLEGLMTLGGPRVIIVYLDKGTAAALLSNGSLISRLREYALNGTYVMFAFRSEDFGLASRVWERVYGEPFPYKSGELTITKVMSNGQTSYIIEKNFFVEGQTYKYINGHRVTVGVGGAGLYKDPSNLSKAMDDALEGMLKSLVYTELTLTKNG